MKKTLILVVDDSEVILKIIRLYLINAGFEVITRSRPIGTAAEILRI